MGLVLGLLVIGGTLLLSAGDKLPPVTSVPTSDSGSSALLAEATQQHRKMERSLLVLREFLGEDEGPPDENEQAHVERIKKRVLDSELIELIDQFLSDSRRWLQAEAAAGEPLTLEGGSAFTRERLMRLIEDLLHLVRDLYLLNREDTRDIMGFIAQPNSEKVALRKSTSEVGGRLNHFWKRLRRDFPVPPTGVLLLEGIAASLSEDERVEDRTGKLIAAVILEDLERALERSTDAVTTSMLSRVMSRMISNLGTSRLCSCSDRSQLLERIRDHALPAGRTADDPGLTEAFLDLFTAVSQFFRICPHSANEEALELFDSLLTEAGNIVHLDAIHSSRIRTRILELAASERVRLDIPSDMQKTTERLQELARTFERQDPPRELAPRTATER